MVDSIGRRISDLRRERGYSQEELAEMALISRVTLARYENGTIEPGSFALSRIADALGTTTDDLLCRTAKMPPFIPLVPSAVPVVGEIACGVPITAEQNIEGYAAIPDGVTADFALKCKGDSMTPTINPGDLVLIRQTPDVVDGQIAAVGVGGDATLKRVYKTENGVVCVSDNPAYAPQIYTDDVTIYGVAVGFVRMW